MALTWIVASVALAAVPALQLSSPDFKPDRPIPQSHVLSGFGCSGANHSPALHWRGAPPGTKSFVVTMFDLDESGSPSGWWHWIVYDLPGTASDLPENAGVLQSTELPAGAKQGRTDMGEQAYHGPCPDLGQKPHRYQITLYALNIEQLPVPADSSGAMVVWTAHEHVLAKATLTARYGR